jgi:hypothetical protein
VLSSFNRRNGKSLDALCIGGKLQTSESTFELVIAVSWIGGCLASLRGSGGGSWFGICMRVEETSGLLQTEESRLDPAKVSDQ